MKRMFVFAVLVVSAFANAQTVVDPVNISFRGGFVYPLDEVTRSITSNMVGFGADIFLERNLFSGGETTFSVDWIGRGLNGDKGNMFPITLTQRWYTGGEYENANRSYYFLGVGIAIIDVINTKTVAAARAGIGLEFSSHVFGEATLFYSDAASGARATAVGMYLGYRF